MADKTVEQFMVALGFQVDAGALDEALVKLRELNALANSLERLKTLGVHIEVTMDASPSRAGFVVSQ